MVWQLFFSPASHSVQSLSCVRLFATPWITARQASLSITNSQSSPKLMSIESVMPFSYHILCHPLLLLPPILPASESFPMSQLFAWGGQSTGVSALASVLPKNTQDWSPLEWTGWISLQSKGLSGVFSNTTVQKHQFFSAELSSQLHITTLLFGSCHICLLSGPQMLLPTVPLLCNDCQFNCHFLREAFPPRHCLTVCLSRQLCDSCLPSPTSPSAPCGWTCVWFQLCLQYLAQCWCHEYLWKGTCRKEKRSSCISSRESEVQASSLREAGCCQERWMGTSWRMEKHREWVLASWRLCFW